MESRLFSVCFWRLLVSVMKPSLMEWISKSVKQPALNDKLLMAEMSKIFYKDIPQVINFWLIL